MTRKYPGITNLQHEECNIDIRGRVLHVFGSPWTPKYGSWLFQYPRIFPSQITSSPSPWNSIPLKTDILITHGPPAHHRDNEGKGCLALLDKIWSLEPKPLLHVFGHIHVGRGIERVSWTRGQRLFEKIATREWEGALIAL